MGPCWCLILNKIFTIRYMEEQKRENKNNQNHSYRQDQISESGSQFTFEIVRNC